MNHPSVKKLASTVKTVRDCLRKVGITDMDSMMHNVLFVAARMLDLNTCKHLVIPPTYQWDNIMKKIADKDTEGADKLFKSILKMLDTHFGLNGFPYSLSSVDDFVIIMKAYAAVDIHEAAKHTDVLGYIYEQHLSTGAGSGRDLGKFYTDRQITRYLTELLGVDISSAGRPDSMCDATMGTGGFILSYIDLVHQENPNVKWELMDLAGGDIDDKVAAIARLNVFIRTGKIFPMIRQRNTLKNDICDSEKKTERRTFDRLLMNIPFGVKGLTLADDCCTRVKDIVKKGTKSEPLFMALTCQLLAEGGKAAVIVPDGVLVNSSTQHDILRKYLLDNFKVQRIIKMRGKFFMNTGIQPSVIVFERSGKTEQVEFWDVEKIATGELVEKCLLTVAREKFDASCSFDMRRYQEVKAVANPAGFPMIKMGDYLEDVKTGKNKNDLIEGDYPFYMSNGISQYANTYQFDGEYVLTGRCGSLNGSQYYVNGKFSASDFTYVLKPKDGLSAKYLYYYMRFIDWTNWQTGTTMKGIRREVITNYAMPLPPIETQQEIVATLDRIYAPGTTELAETLKLTDKAMDLVLANPGGASLEPIVEAQRLMRKSAQMVADVKAQMVAVVKASCSNGADKPLTEVCKTKMGFPFKSSDYTTEGLIVVKHNNITDEGYVKVSKKQDYIPSTGQTDDYTLTIGDIVVSMDFDCGKVGKIVESGWVLNQRVCLMRTNTEILSQEYLYWLLRFGGFYETMQSLHTGTTIKHIGGKDIDKAVLKVPSIEVQTQTLQRLNTLQIQLSSLENLGKQAEDNARFILDSYLNTA